jgi:hypothetical protein
MIIIPHFVSIFHILFCKRKCGTMKLLWTMTVRLLLREHCKRHLNWEGGCKRPHSLLYTEVRYTYSSHSGRQSHSLVMLSWADARWAHCNNALSSGRHRTQKKLRKKWVRDIITLDLLQLFFIRLCRTHQAESYTGDSHWHVLNCLPTSFASVADICIFSFKTSRIFGVDKQSHLRFMK